MESWEVDAQLVGVGTYMFVVRVPESGLVAYTFDRRPLREIHLSRGLGGRRLGTLALAC